MLSREIDTEANTQRLGEVMDFVNAFLEEINCPMKSLMQISVAVEEIFVNIASYAYAPGSGRALIKIEETDGEVNITFIDSGIKYDPLAKDDPDVTLSAEEREIGGLGIFMVKKTMDSIKYEYKEGKNILSIAKRVK